MIKKLRKNQRLRYYDYHSNGAYFVTICTNFKKKIINGKEKDIIVSELSGLPQRFKGLAIDYYVVMPGHIHIMLLLNNSMVSLGRIIQAFKSITTLRFKKKGYAHKTFWQRNYYEHVIRDEASLRQIRKYIQNNPEAERIELTNRSDRISKNRSGRANKNRSGRACSAQKASHKELNVEQARPLQFKK